MPIEQSEQRGETENSGRLKDLEESLKSMKGAEMQALLDRQRQLNGALSPIDATDPNRKTEYEHWLSVLEDSRRATQELIENLNRRIEAQQEEIYRLEREQKK